MQDRKTDSVSGTESATHVEDSDSSRTELHSDCQARFILS